MDGNDSNEAGIKPIVSTAITATPRPESGVTATPAARDSLPAGESPQAGEFSERSCPPTEWGIDSKIRWRISLIILLLLSLALWAFGAGVDRVYS
jgi:hypothetical protein